MKETVYLDIPTKCPVCGGATEIRQDNESEVLMCTNDNCKGKLLGKLAHFVSKNAINVDGLSESTLEKFIELGWLNDFKDIFTLKDHFTEMVKLDGFGETSANKLLNAIEASRNTTLDRFIYSLSIPLIGRSASKTIAKHFDYDFNKLTENFGFWGGFDWTILDDFGSAMSDSMDKFITDNVTRYFVDLPKYFTFEKLQATTNTNNLSGLAFVITGSLNHFANRDEVKEKIEAAGGKVSGSVSAKTNFLICNEASSSSKYKKAKEIGVKVLTEKEFITRFGIEI